MVFEDLLTIVGRAPLFDTGLLLAGDVNPDYLRRQLSEWVSGGKLWQLRRGLYTLAPPYQKTPPHPFVAANHMVTGSYVSLQTALGYYGLIPEHVAAVTSVTTGRPGEWENPVAGQFAFVASREKALLDLIYLTPEGESTTFLESLRLQNLAHFDPARFRQFAEEIDKPKLYRAADAVSHVVAAEREAYEPL